MGARAGISMPTFWIGFNLICIPFMTSDITRAVCGRSPAPALCRPAHGAWSVRSRVPGRTRESSTMGHQGRAAGGAAQSALSFPVRPIRLYYAAALRDFSRQ
jgi:hypothetical protein